LFKHNIKDQNIIKILADLENKNHLKRKKNEVKTVKKKRFNMRSYKKTQTLKKYNSARRPKVEFNSLRSINSLNENNDKLLQLEKVMKLYRGDQLFGPVVKFFNKQLINYQRNFFIKLRFSAKLTPFKLLSRFVIQKKRSIMKKALFNMFFYNRSYLKFVIFVFIFNKLKQKIFMETFKQLKATQGLKNKGTLPQINLVKDTKKTGKLLSIDIKSFYQNYESQMKDFQTFKLLSESKGFKKNDSKVSNTYLINLLSPQSCSIQDKDSKILSLNNSIISKFIKNFNNEDFSIPSLEVVNISNTLKANKTTPNLKIRENQNILNQKCKVPQILINPKVQSRMIEQKRRRNYRILSLIVPTKSILLFQCSKIKKRKITKLI
jgi:hypothetical protein